ncbi:hypothetical protein Bca4012_012987 [Brassica carinata]
MPSFSHTKETLYNVDSMTAVAKLIDEYLAEVAPDVNLKLPKFQALSASVPENARLLDDGLYRAIDIYLKHHPWLAETERENLCRLLDCQKLSLEACTHAEQNKRLSLRIIVQVFFFEQEISNCDMRLRSLVRRQGWWWWFGIKLKSHQMFSVQGSVSKSNNENVKIEKLKDVEKRRGKHNKKASSISSER